MWGGGVLCIFIAFLFAVSTDHKVRQFGRGSGPIFLDDLNCDGTESSLLDCRRNGLDVGIHNCDHSDDAGVQCSGI